MSDSIENDNQTIKKTKQLIEFSKHLPGDATSPKDITELKKLTTLPDKFNNAFTSKGWVFVGFCSGTDTASKALEMRSNGSNDDEIDTLLSNSFINYHPAVTQISNALRLNGDWDDVSSALDIFERAYKAHEDEDYIVSVPLFLMVIDNLSLSRTGTKSIFSDVENFGANFKDQNSFAGHPTALPEVMKIINKSKKGPNDEMITIPYRHGIMHGTRLNYGNKVVSAKALNLLAAVVEWIKDTKPPSKVITKRKSNNTDFLQRNLIRLNPQNPDEALTAFKNALIQKKPNEIVALLNLDPNLTNFVQKMESWKEWLQNYEILIEENSEWTVCGEDSDKAQFAKCNLKYSIKSKATSVKIQLSEEIQASRGKEITDFLGKPYWQIDLCFMGTISHQINTLVTSRT